MSTFDDGRQVAMFPHMQMMHEVFEDIEDEELRSEE